MVTLSGAIYGKYYFVETKAPLGYELPDENTFYPTVLQDAEPDKIVSIVIENKRKSGQLVLRKSSDLNDQFPVEGAVFGLHYSTGESVDYNGSLTTDENGEIEISGLAWGDYYLKELEAPYGFNVPDEAKNKYPFTIRASNDAGELLTLNITNPQEPGDVYLIKTELLEDGTSNPSGKVSGAYYTLYTESGKKVGTYRTDNDGMIHVEGLGYQARKLQHLRYPKGTIQYTLVGMV